MHFDLQRYSILFRFLENIQKLKLSLDGTNSFNKSVHFQENDDFSCNSTNFKAARAPSWKALQWQPVRLNTAAALLQIFTYQIDVFTSVQFCLMVNPHISHGIYISIFHQKVSFLERLRGTETLWQIGLLWRSAFCSSTVSWYNSNVQTTPCQQI